MTQLKGRAEARWAERKEANEEELRWLKPPESFPEVCPEIDDARGARIDAMLAKYEAELGGGLSLVDMESVLGLGAYLIFPSAANWTASHYDHEHRVRREELRDVARAYWERNGGDSLDYLLSAVEREVESRQEIRKKELEKQLTGDEEVYSEECFEALEESTMEPEGKESAYSGGMLAIDKIKILIGRDLEHEINQLEALKIPGKLTLQEWCSALGGFKAKRGAAILEFYLVWLRGSLIGFIQKMPRSLPDGVIAAFSELAALTESKEHVTCWSVIEEALAGSGLEQCATQQDLDINEDGRITADEFSLFYLRYTVEKSVKATDELVAAMIKGATVISERRAEALHREKMAIAEVLQS